MDVNFELTLSPEASKKLDEIKDVEVVLKNGLLSKGYGKDLETLSVKISIVNPPEGFEHLFKKLSPKYIDNKIVRNKYTGQQQIFNKHFFFSIVIIGDEYDRFVSSTDDDIKKFLAKKILDGFESLDSLPKKVRDFDKERFKADVYQFFRSNGLI